MNSICKTCNGTGEVDWGDCSPPLRCPACKGAGTGSQQGPQRPEQEER